MVEGTGLENQQACKRLVGSNPTPSATEGFTIVGSRRKRFDMIPEPLGKLIFANGSCRESNEGAHACGI